MVEINKSLLDGLDYSTKEKATKLLQDFTGEIKQNEFVISEENAKTEKYQVLINKN